ncbi:hypothetical protein BH23CHL2_BH23CHL2_25120 [soil metagenome]
MEDSEQVGIGNGEIDEAIEPGGQPDEAGGAGDAAEDLDGVRELILRAYPDIVPELLAGESVDRLLASVPAAREAYSRVAAAIHEQAPAPVPTGSGRRPPIDPEGLSPEGKIRAGLRRPSL